MKVEIPETEVSVEFDEEATEPTEVVYLGLPEPVTYIKLLLSEELGSRGHFIDPEREYPGDLQKGLNQAFDLGLKVTGAIRPAAPEGAQD
jgi:hypothetical protein